jgi:hypothetical protein
MRVRGWALRLRRGRARDERGAVAIMMALTLAVVLVAAGMVLDFGLARYDRSMNKSTADSAALAGAAALDQLDGSFHPWKGVCAALAYIQSNDQGLGTITGSYKNGSGSGISGSCSGSTIPNDTVCVASTPTTWAWFHGTGMDGRYTIDIKSGYTTPDSNWPEDTAFTTDNSKMGGCDQLAVIISETETPGLGSLATSDDLQTNVRSVARLTPSTTGEVPIALLLLERHDCLALDAQSNNTYFDVLGFGTAAGLIHSDSLGDKTGTGSNCNSSNKVINTTFAKHIVARHSETGGFPGLITTAAGNSSLGGIAANATSGAANVCAEQSNGSCAAGTGANFIGRYPIDNRYLSGVRNWMSIGTSTTTGSGMSTTTANAAGYTVWNAGSCNNLQTSDMPANVANKALVYVNCPSGASFKNFTFANATNVVFNGSVTISSGNTLSIPKAQRVYVKGDASSHTGINAQGNLSLQTGAAATCSAASPTARDKLVIANGSFTGGAQSSFHMCFTTLLMADGWNGSSCPVPSVPTPVTTEPADNTCWGSVGLGGGGTMDWTAPNLTTTKADSTAWADLEDLTLWTETSGTGTVPSSKIGGGGTMTLSGVLFLPNANPFIISGGGFQSNGADAQFIARRLTANGQGTLYMRPNPANAINIPAAATYALVR